MLRAAMSLPNSCSATKNNLGASSLPRSAPRISGGKRPTQPKAQMIVPAFGGAVATVGRAEVLWNVAKGTAADDTATAIILPPRRAVRGRAVIVILIAVLDPLPDIAK